ncbi:MAG: hypothetical protein D4R72_06090 [Nitrosopumilales archaeon]|nr:MAG: hypothetical protein D4R72_06090 [Nitrosopumilales archaeon]
MKIGQERLLVIAPHADDEVLGCFGLINKVKENGGRSTCWFLPLEDIQKQDLEECGRRNL